jgi:hypothetical protein
VERDSSHSVTPACIVHPRHFVGGKQVTQIKKVKHLLFFLYLTAECFIALYYGKNGSASFVSYFIMLYNYIC